VEGELIKTRHRYLIYQSCILQEAILLEDWFAPNDTTNPQTSLQHHFVISLLPVEMQHPAHWWGSISNYFYHVGQQ